MGDERYLRCAIIDCQHILDIPSRSIIQSFMQKSGKDRVLPIFVPAVYFRCIPALIRLQIGAEWVTLTVIQSISYWGPHLCRAKYSHPYQASISIPPCLYPVSVQKPSNWSPEKHASKSKYSKIIPKSWSQWIGGFLTQGLAKAIGKCGLTNL